LHAIGKLLDDDHGEESPQQQFGFLIDAPRQVEEVGAHTMPEKE
jgi:hypothetical protein